jgi:glycosyltransferase involved in cell wall biosynthesis
MTIVSPSKWLAEKARKSSLMRSRNIHVIPNGIDHRIFKSPGKSVARDILNIPRDKLIILFGAMRGINNPRKGFQYLIPAMHKISTRLKHVEAMVIGSDGSSQNENFGCKTTYLGVLHDEFSLSLAYSAADITVVPSTDENLCTIIMESLSCGTPVVGFDIGGNAELVEHQQNGYLARAFEVEDLARGIEWVISDQARHAGLCLRARKKIEEEFMLDLVAKKYMDLYEAILN